MHNAGKLFPRSDRAPAIQPVGEVAIWRRLTDAPEMSAWRFGRTKRITSGFYKSQAMEFVRA
jgi:magnesium-protoporphyrin O-methyltransferase